jgi:pimeloyl-ACP methyl ester carboxylesterase
MPTVSTFVGKITDANRNRVIDYKLWFPNEERPVALKLIIISHGGDGNTTGHLQFFHLGQALAEAGFVALHVNHLPSTDRLKHRFDRPLDISFVLNELSHGRLERPLGLAMNAERVGIIGHSWGAYTGHALAGGHFEHGDFTDSRVVSLVALSPQGPGQFGSFDNGPTDNTWVPILVPILNIVGELEKDSSVTEGIMKTDWRLIPFQRSSSSSPKILSVIPGQNHDQIGTEGSLEVKNYIAKSVTRFFEFTMTKTAVNACGIGKELAPEGTRIARKGATGIFSECAE